MKFICHFLLPILLLLLGTGDAMEGSLRLAEDHDRDLKNSNGSPSGDRKLQACRDQYDKNCDVFVPIRFGVCQFPFLIKDRCINGLPPSAVDATTSQGLNLGAFTDLLIHRLDKGPCSQILSTYLIKGKGANLEKSDGNTYPITWQGNFLLIRPAGQVSEDPRIPTGVGSLLLLSGKITFADATFKVTSYVGEAPFDVCAALSE